jgi:hypothetical protein
MRRRTLELAGLKDLQILGLQGFEIPSRTK